MSLDPPISYIERTTSYYLGLGYDNPYRWARCDTVPFTRPSKSLKDMRVAIVTTAAPFQPDKGDQGPGASYNASAKFYQLYRLPIDPEPDLRISHIAIDRVHTTAEDKATYFPLAALKQAVADGQIGAVAPFIYGFPTNRSQRTHLEQDCPALTSALLEDNVEAIILVPNCPVCHQSVALAARAAEEAGIATVIMGCAKDIVEQVGVPRFYFSDFPLGNSCGRPNDSLSQQQTLAGALTLLSSATAPRTTITNPIIWDGAENWKDDYSNINKLSAKEIARRRAEFDAAKTISHQQKR